MQVRVAPTTTARSAGPVRSAGPAAVITRISSGDQIARWVRTRIVEGALRPGDKVLQDEVARELGVSRIPVREALVALDREGWVTIEPHRGAFVCSVDEAWVRDHYDVLGVLWGLAAARAAQRGTDDEIATLRTLQRELHRSDGPGAFDTANQRVLQHLLAMARSPRLVTAMRAVTSIVPGNFFVAVPAAVEPQRRGIASMAKAIAARDGVRARSVLERLLETDGALVVELLLTRGVIAPDGEAR